MITKVEYFNGAEAVMDGVKNRFFEGILDDCLITSIYRRGKHIIFELAKEKKNILDVLETEYWYFVTHLSLNGSFRINKTAGHTKVYFLLKSKDSTPTHHHYTHLYYNDIMKRGSLRLMTQNELLLFCKRNPVGVDVLTSTSEEISKRLRIGDTINKKWCHLPIHQVLLDQKLLSGLGNIYANEVLFRSKINPLKNYGDCNFAELDVLGLSIYFIIKQAYKSGGSSIKDYTNVYGVAGGYQFFHKVYGKENDECQDCGNCCFIDKIKIDGRSVFYCKHCQT